MFDRQVRVHHGTVGHVGYGLALLAADVQPGALLHQELHHLVIAAIGGAVQGGVVVSCPCALTSSPEFDAVAHRIQPGIGNVTRRVGAPAQTRGHHQRGDAFLGGDLRVCAGRDQDSHSRYIARLGRPPERCGAFLIDPLLVVRGGPEPQCLGEPGVRICAVRQQGLSSDRGTSPSPER